MINYNRIDTIRSYMMIVLNLIVFTFMVGCKETGINEPLEAGVQPAPVKNIVAIGKHGGAIIQFEVADKNTRYVVAEYVTQEGVEKNSKSSKYKNEILLDGFPRAGKYNVAVYAVGPGEEKSVPVNIVVDVDTPPVIQAYNTLLMAEDFGGINIQFKNPEQGDLAVDVFSTDSLGRKVLVSTEYTKKANVSFSVRGFKSEIRKFWVVLRDRWNNSSDTVQAQLKPVFEELFPRTRMSQVTLPTDTYEGHSWSGSNGPRTMNFMFDGNTTDALSIFHTKTNTGMPQHFTFRLDNDEKSRFKLSRFKIWMRNEAGAKFNGPSPRVFVVYGSTNPDPAGSWNGWTELGKYTMEKPSGLPKGSLSAEDELAHTSGIEFTVPIKSPEVRYIRVETLETWGALQYIAIAEMAVWGAKVVSN